MTMTKALPNLLSAARIFGSAAMPMMSPDSLPFWTVYVLCGVSDIMDGALARRFHAESRTGAMLDSVGDLLFVTAVLIRIFPLVSVPAWLWAWASGITLI